jgi:gamma-glutamylcyclotransferase (GGCT)/AIG2-like uncharacterized protein YtfP
VRAVHVTYSVLICAVISANRVEFWGKGETEERFPLVIGKAWRSPFLLFQPGKGHRIVGEVYSVDSKALEILDELETYPIYYTVSLCIPHDIIAKSLLTNERI